MWARVHLVRFAKQVGIARGVAPCITILALGRVHESTNGYLSKKRAMFERVAG